jgi:RNA polymerase sigma-70 factor (ECF subfamily)
VGLLYCSQSITEYHPPQQEVPMDKESKMLLADAIHSLPERQRVAFILHKYENLTYKDISEILGVSINSVEARLHRAKVALQKKWWFV